MLGEGLLCSTVGSRAASQPDWPSWMGSIPLTGSASCRSRGGVLTTPKE